MSNELASIPQLSPIHLPSHVLALIILHLRDVIRATIDANAYDEWGHALRRWQEDSRERIARKCRVMIGIGSVSKGWRRLATEMMMNDEEFASLRVKDTLEMTDCLCAFPHARSLRVACQIKGRQLLSLQSMVRLELGQPWDEKLRQARQVRQAAHAAP